MEFKKYKIQEIGEVIGGGTPSTKKSEYYGGNIPWITPKDLSNFKEVFISEGERNITEEGLKNSSARTLPSNTVLMTSRAPIGYLAIAKNEVTTNQGFKSIICNESLVKPLFLYYSLKNDMDKIKSLGTGSTFSEISGKVVKNIEINIPSIEYQTIIEYILGNFDKKIELNQKIIANLEELSQTLFKRWFVDFEFPDENGNPYKSSGGEMVDSEIGEIPKEWYIKSINEITSRVRTGLNPRKNFVLGYGENYYVTIKNMSNNNIYLNEKCDRINDEALKIINKRSDLKKNDILFSGIGTIGRVYLVSEEPENWNISESIFTLRPSESLYSYYLYQLMLSENLQNYVQQLSSGSVQKGIRKGDLIKFKLPISKNNFIENLYSNKIKNYIFKVQNLRKENLKLVKLRDTLLPKLMSGEIEIPDDIEVNEDELSI